MIVSKPQASELSEYYQTYLRYIPEEDLMETLLIQSKEAETFLSQINIDQSEIAYAPGKWLIKEVVGHLCDTERILAYRSLRIARGDKTPLSAFDEDEYMRNANFRERAWDSIRKEKSIIREASLAFFQSLDLKTFMNAGIANQQHVTVAALLFFIIAHERHHLHVIKERYLLQ